MTQQKEGRDGAEGAPGYSLFEWRCLLESVVVLGDEGTTIVVVVVVIRTAGKALCG